MKYIWYSWNHIISTSGWPHTVKAMVCFLECLCIGLECLLDQDVGCVALYFSPHMKFLKCSTNCDKFGPRTQSF